MALKSFEFVVKGTVHDVGFRYYVKELARAEGIVGWVKNDPQGDVVGLAQGSDAALEKLKQALHTGPRHAKVTGVEIKSESTVPRPQFTSFDIAH